jgi:hypothetical protein
MALPASDTFSGTAGQDLPVYSANWAAAMASGTAVFECDGSGNAVTPPALNNTICACKWTGDTFANDQYAEVVTDPGNGSYLGPAIRAGTAGNMYGLFSDDVTIDPVVMTSGSASALGASIGISWGSGTHTLRISAVGTTITITYDGAETTRTDATYSSGSAGLLGVSTSGTPTVIPSWTAGDVTAPPVSRVNIGTKVVAGTTTVVLGYPAGVAADQIALACRVGWENAVTFSDEAGWTNTASLAGGTGTAADAHTTTVRVDRKELVGSESGTVTFDQTGSAQAGVAGVMVTYQLGDTSNTWDVATSTGDDATHGANRSVTGSSSIPLAVGDVVVAVAAVDTDASLTITSPAITASGITFGATTRLTSGAGSGQGDDGNVEVFEAKVTAGSGTVAPTLAFTTATSQCGPVAFVRLRAVAGGTTFNITPSASTTVAGSSLKQVNKRATASTTATGVTPRQVNKRATASTTGTGATALSKVLTRLLSGSTTPSAVLALTRVLLRSFGGSTTATGQSTRLTFKRLVASTTTVGVLTKALSRMLSASTTTTAVVRRQTNKGMAGSTTASSTLAMTKVLLRLMQASTTTTGTLTRTLTTARLWAASTTATATVGRQIAKPLAASTTGTGVVRRTTLKGFVASTTATAAVTLTKVLLRLFNASTTATGVLSFGGAVTRLFAGSTATSSALRRRVDKALAGSSAPEGLVRKAIATRLVASTTASATVTMTKVLLRTFSAVTTATGLVRKLVGKTTAGSTTSTGTVRRQTNLVLSGSTSTSGSSIKAIAKGLVASTATAGVSVVGRQLAIMLSASTVAFSTLARQVMDQIVAVFAGWQTTTRLDLDRTTTPLDVPRTTTRLDADRTTEDLR